MLAIWVLLAVSVTDAYILSTTFGGLDGEISLDRSINCTSSWPESDNKFHLVRHYDTPRSCDELKIDLGESKDIDDVFRNFSTMQKLYSADEGDVIQLREHSTFDFSIVAINYDTSDSLAWLLKVLNLYKRPRVPHLFVLVAPRIKFSTNYNRILFEKIMESKQILHVFTLETPPIDISHTIIGADNVEFTVNFSSINTLELKIGDSVIEKSFNIIANTECDFPLCYTECDDSLRPTDFCVSWNNTEYSMSNDIIRHFSYNSARRSRRSIPPDWFMRWLASREEYIADPGLDADRIFGVPVTILDAFTIDSPDPFSRTLNTTISRNGKQLPVYNFANCYHGIIVNKFNTNRKCLVYSIN